MYVLTLFRCCSCSQSTVGITSLNIGTHTDFFPVLAHAAIINIDQEENKTHFTFIFCTV